MHLRRQGANALRPRLHRDLPQTDAREGAGDPRDRIPDHLEQLSAIRGGGPRRPPHRLHLVLHSGALRGSRGHSAQVRHQRRKNRTVPLGSHASRRERWIAWRFFSGCAAYRRGSVPAGPVSCAAFLAANRDGVSGVLRTTFAFHRGAVVLYAIRHDQPPVTDLPVRCCQLLSAATICTRSRQRLFVIRTRK